MSLHLLHIEGDGDDRVYRLECPNDNGCSGWVECREPHEVNGVSANMGPYDDCPGTHPDDREIPVSEHHPWCDEEEFEFHGVVHVWRSGHDWTVPYDGCIVMFADWEPPDDAPLASPGTYRVDSDWDDVDVYLQFVETALYCGCGCGLSLEDAKRNARANSGWLNPDQAEAQVVRNSIRRPVPLDEDDTEGRQ